MTQLDITPEIIEAIRRVVDYLWEDEQRDYDNSTKEQKNNHIYYSLLGIQFWLSFVEGQPSSES